MKDSSAFSTMIKDQYLARFDLIKSVSIRKNAAVPNQIDQTLFSTIEF